jgi:hypothetical protein
VQQQDFYTQLINNFGGGLLGQLVGDLWITREIGQVMPYGGFWRVAYYGNGVQQARILSNFVISSK